MASSQDAHQTIDRKKKQFVIHKLEERIAPAKGGIRGNPYHCPLGQLKKGNCYPYYVPPPDPCSYYGGYCW